MATATTKYHLTKPATGESYSVATLDTNYDLIDAALPTFPPGGKPFGHLGKTAGFQTIASTTPILVTFTASQQLKGGMAFDSASSSLTVPVAGTYTVRISGYATGATAYQHAFITRINAVLATQRAHCGFWKANSQDYLDCASCVMPLNAGDKISVWSTTDTAGSGSTWGTTGYDGVYLEVEWFDQ